MNDFPKELIEYLSKELFVDRLPAYFIVNDHFELIESGGKYSNYGIDDNNGTDLSKDLSFLREYFPISASPLILPKIKLENGITTDIHIIKFKDFNCILLLDASLSDKQEFLIQQIANDMRLMRNKEKADGKKELDFETIFSSLFSVLDIVILEKMGNGSFSLIGGLTDWFLKLFPDSVSSTSDLNIGSKFIFLENFLVDANLFWNENRAGLLKSGSWMEYDLEGNEYYLEAIAINILKNKILLFELSRSPMKDKHLIIQKARQKNLELYKLDKEIQKKEVLIHCIIHDLVNPLSIINYSAEICLNDDFNDEKKDFLLHIREQTERMKIMIDETLDVMTTDVDKLRSFNFIPEDAPDLIECIEKVINDLTGIFKDQNVKLVFKNKIKNRNEYKVVSEESRLKRVLTNLLDNSLRYSPRNSEVKIEVDDVNEYYFITIDDQGPGIEQNVSKKLFDKSYQEGESAGVAGLGLYFCRISVERWGGSIGCENLPDKGARFWFNIKKVDSN